MNILLGLLLSIAAHSQQFYFRGVVKDPASIPLQNVSIIHLRTGYVYKSGSTGTFGIISTQAVDSFRFELSGYKTDKKIINSADFSTVQLKLAPPVKTTIKRNNLSSLTRGLTVSENRHTTSGNETYNAIIDNQFINATRFPQTGISLNVDRASYSNIRRFLNLSERVPSDAVRIEEMLNYFNLFDDRYAGDQLFNVQTRLTTCPWNTANQLYYINLSAKKLNFDSLPPNQLVFLVDVSSSMDMANRLPLLQSAFKVLVKNLRARDSVSIVVYGGVTGIMMMPTSGADKEKIYNKIDELTPGGATPGESGIKLAYQLAKKHFIKGGNNRIILATDGDFNVGVRTEEELDELISQHRQSEIYLTCLGVGMGNYKDSKIQTLARKGNGNFAYIDNYFEAEKVLLKEFSQTLFTVADNVYMDVNFDPAWVQSYRLIGFDNKVEALHDSLAAIEGGELGSGYSMMGLFEITPASPLPKGTMQTAINIQYRLPKTKEVRTARFQPQNSLENFSQAESKYRFAATVSLFGSLLRESSYIGKFGWEDMRNLAVATVDQQDILQHEFLTLVLKASDIYTRKKKRKTWDAISQK